MSGLTIERMELLTARDQEHSKMERGLVKKNNSEMEWVPSQVWVPSQIVNTPDDSK